MTVLVTETKLALYRTLGYYKGCCKILTTDGMKQAAALQEASKGSFAAGMKALCENQKKLVPTLEKQCNKKNVDKVIKTNMEAFRKAYKEGGKAKGKGKQ